MAVTSLRFLITSTWNGNGVRAARRDISAASSDIQSASRRLGASARGFFTLTNAALALGPALVPIGGVSLGITAGLAAAVAGAGLAAGAFGALAITAAKNAAVMGASGKEFTKNVSGVRDAWINLAQATAPYTLGPMTSVLRGLQTAIPKIQPLIKAMAPDMAAVGKAIQGWLAGGGFERLISVLTTQGVPALRNFIAAGRDFAAVIGRGFRDFLPLGVQVSAVIARGAAALRQWAEGGGFQRFLAYVRANAPAVGEFFRALGSALSNLGAALRIAGPLALQVATALLKIVAAVPPEMLARIVQGYIALRLAIIGLRVATLAAAAIRLLAAALTLLLAHPVVAFLAVLAAAIYLAYQKWQQFKAAGGSPAQFIVRILNHTGFIVAVNAARIAWGLLQRAIKVVTFIVRIVAGAVRATISGLQTAWNALVAVSRRVASFVARLVGGALNAIMNRLRSAWAAVIAVARAVTFVARLVGGGLNAIMNRLRSAWSSLIGVARKVANFIAKLVGGGLAGAMRGLVSAWNSVLGAARKVATFISRVVTGKAGGGPVAGYAGGGRIRGKGGPTGDKVPINASPGEWVIRARAARQWGPAAMSQINAGPRPGMAGGGTPSYSRGSGSSRGGGGYHIHIHGNVYTKSEREFEDMLAGAMTEMKRKGRLPK